MKIDRTQAPVASSRYAVREADLCADRQTILDLWALKEGGSPINGAKLDWFYEANPAGKGWIFLLVDRVAECPVGVIGAVPRKFTGPGGSLTGAVMIDFVVHRDHRTLGPGLLLQREACAAIEERVDIIFSFPNVRSGVLRRRSGFDEHRELRQLVCPVDLREYLAKSVPGPIRALAAVVHRGFLLGRWKLSSPGTRWTGEMRPSFADGLHTQVAQGRGGYFGDRSFDCLGWRLLNHPRKDINFFCQEGRNGEPKGYIAWTRTKHDKVTVVDFNISPGHRPGKLFGAFMCKMAAERAMSVAIEVDEARRSILRKLTWLGFHDRGSTDLYIMRGRGHRAGDSLPRLVLSRYDGDG